MNVLRGMKRAAEGLACLLAFASFGFGDHAEFDWAVNSGGGWSTGVGLQSFNYIGEIYQEDVLPGAAANEVPTITSFDGNATVALSIVEGNRFGQTVRATDPDGDALVYSLLGGADDGEFSINAATGE
ncbi:MAG: cadherin repeat domain-containing protein, partial [Rhodospirillaceae bacterium]|nr:cadherin repeat domain-containing protein [Rhodospirillaceae bacterium]